MLNTDADACVAVLVDCDNIKPDVLDFALRIVAQFDRVVLHRGYANHAMLANTWQEALVRLAFTPSLQYPVRHCKNTLTSPSRYGDASPEDTSEADDRGYYTAVNVFWVPEAARWEALRAQAMRPEIGKLIDEALGLIEAENLQVQGHPRQTLCPRAAARRQAGRTGGPGVHHRIRRERQYGPRRARAGGGHEPAIRGIDFNLGREPGDTFARNQHPDLRADFILANSPFTISDWWDGSLEGAQRGLWRPTEGQRTRLPPSATRSFPA